MYTRMPLELKKRDTEGEARTKNNDSDDYDEEEVAENGNNFQFFLYYFFFTITSEQVSERARIRGILETILFTFSSCCCVSFS